MSFFIGQEHIILQLGDILPFLRDEKTGINILFRGPSGYGKTELAKKCCKFLVGQNYEFCLGDDLRFNRESWVHFIDEVHLMENPEVLYPIMDMNKYVFIFATNFDSVLPEALTNRCRNFIFSEYSNDELSQIFLFHSKLRFPDEVVNHIIEISGRNPRVIVRTFSVALYMHYRRQINIPEDANEIIATIDKIFGISEGLDTPSREYLKVLEGLGGRAAINLISAKLRLDINTIKYTIEPILLYKNLIKITSRGRELI